MKATEKVLALMATAALLVASVPCVCMGTVQADTTSASELSTVAAEADSSNYRNYINYLSSIEANDANGEIFVSAKSGITNITEGVAIASEEEYEQVYKMSEEGGVTFTFSVAESAFYTAELVFTNTQENTETYDYSIKIDGKYPFSACEELTVNALWEDDGEIRELANGYQVAPLQKHIDGFVSRAIIDDTGIVSEPYRFYLSAGKHTVTVTQLSSADMILAAVRFKAPEVINSYEDVSQNYSQLKRYNGNQIVIEGEDSYYRSAYSLTSKSDNSSVNVSPSSAVKSLINYIGGTTWSKIGNEIAWQFDVPEDGLYKLGFSFKQTGVQNGQVYRWLKIDGKTPFSEASEIGFEFKNAWQFKPFADDEGNDYLVYLTKGPHTLSLAVTLSDISIVYEKLSDIVQQVSDLYLDIVMITGENPDSNRNYQLDKQIPDFAETLDTLLDSVNALNDDLKNGLEANGELDGSLNNMARILKKMRSSLYNAHLQLSAYYSQYQTLSAWLQDILEMPLSIDRIILAAPDAPYKDTKATFLEKIRFSLERYVSSYTSSTAMVSITDESYPTIKLWANWGRDQVKILSTMIQDFSSKYKINVVFEQVNASLVQGIISNNSPDIYLHMSRTEPVNLAMRGVLYDLTQFSDCDEVLKNFQDGADTPYRYKDGLYALPDTQSFYVMYYRKDLLDGMGIKVPKTWDEFYEVSGILQRHNMNSYLPYVKIQSTTTVNTGVGGLSIFPSLVLQNGVDIYKSDLSKTNLSSNEAIKAFDFWTEFYTLYGLDAGVNFAQKFRVGTVPIGIDLYSNYQTLKATSPVIDGKWEIAELPGVLNSDGTINNVSSGSGSGCGIMKSSKEKEAAWTFLKWWVSEETQYQYYSEVEAVLGESGRGATSNINAVKRFYWDSNTLEVILSQWEKVQEIPEVPGSYFVSRSVDQAYWAVVNGEDSAKDALIKWAELSDQEIERKTAEYADKKFD